MKNKPVFTKHNVSMTEWVSHLLTQKDLEKFRQEDNTKDDRLEFLYNTIRISYERPTNFESIELKEKSKRFVKFLEKNKDSLCALRLNPKHGGLPKIRNRGLSVKESLGWFAKQEINYSDYIASFRPHADTCLLSVILVVNKKGVFGEVTTGKHSELTQGSTEREATQFSFDFKKWQWRNQTVLAKKTIDRMLKMIKVTEILKRKQITKKLKIGFTQNLLNGYFEAVLWNDNKVRFSDYNRILHTMVERPVFVDSILQDKTESLTGLTVFKGIVKGKVVLINEKNISTIKFPKNSILVTDNTDVRFISFMKKSGAIVTDRGGLLSHAAIVARELKKPCIIGTKIATKVLKDGDYVEVDANTGVVKILKRGN
jgi:phosphohistidine swiveling domain-containing protein